MKRHQTRLKLPFQVGQLFFGLVWLLWASNFAFARPLTALQSAAVDRAVRAEMERQQVVGVAVGVIGNDDIAYLQSYGWADREQKIPVGPQTLFRWASISKTLTAVAALQLVEKGQLDLAADVRSYVPEFPDKGALITSQTLLNHQSGLPHYSNGQVIPTQRTYETAHPFEDVVTALDTFNQSPLLFEPGAKYSYSTYGFMLLSAVVQRAGQEMFASQVQNRIAAPLQLATLQPDYQWKALAGRAAGYIRKNGQIVPSTDTDVSWKLGGGGFISNIGDLARYGQGLLAGRLLASTTLEAMWQPQNTAAGQTTVYGLGFTVQDAATENWKVSHNGSQEKASCRLVIYPRQGHGIVIMTNCDYANAGQFSTAIYAALYQP